MHIRHGRRWGAAVPGLLGLSLLLAACDWSDMAFVQDHRVRFIEPADRSTVTLPVTLSWEVEGFHVTGKDGRALRDAGYFAVFVDRSPIPPGKSLEWLAQQEDSCGSSACGSVDNLSGVYATDDTRLKLTRLSATGRDIEKHEAVVVLLDGTGRRIGESAFYVQFNFERTV